MRQLTEAYLTLALSSIASDLLNHYDCKCGEPPFTDGELCPVCSVTQTVDTLESLGETANSKRSPAMRLGDANISIPDDSISDPIVANIVSEFGASKRVSPIALRIGTQHNGAKPRADKKRRRNVQMCLYSVANGNPYRAFKVLVESWLPPFDNEYSVTVFYSTSFARYMTVETQTAAGSRINSLLNLASVPADSEQAKERDECLPKRSADLAEYLLLTYLSHMSAVDTLALTREMKSYHTRAKNGFRKRESKPGGRSRKREEATPEAVQRRDDSTGG